VIAGRTVLDGSITFRLALPPPAESFAPPWEIQEVARVEVESFFSESPRLAPRTAELDAVSRGPWRCFAAVAGGRPIHHLFVEMGALGPCLFRGETEEGWRGRGVFKSVSWFAGRQLHHEGCDGLLSSCSRRNRRSIRAHLGAGFVVIARRFDPIVFGVHLRRLCGKN
jgi:hypothetical protein